MSGRSPVGHVAPTGSTRARLAELDVLSAVDLHVSEAIGRLTGESDEDVLLAIALASRAPRHGHVCVVLPDVHIRVDIDVDRDGDGRGAAGPDGGSDPAGGSDPDGDHDSAGVEIDWPDTGRWLDALRASPAVRSAGDDETVAPLVLGDQRLYLDRFWRYQQRLTQDLLRRCQGTRDDVDLDLARRRIGELFPGREGELDRQALSAAVSCLRDLTVISGAPGTGKTTTVVRLLALLLETVRAPAAVGGLRIAMAAPTGKAAVRMQEAVREALGDLTAPRYVLDELGDLDARTLHRLLGWQPGSPSRFRHDADDPLPYDVIVIDEASMVPLALMAKLVAAVPRHARLILVGDRDQLASVEAGSVLGDICGPLRGGAQDSLRLSAGTATELEGLVGEELAGEYREMPAPGIWDSIIHLERFHRFGADSGIGAVARAIQSGEHAARTAIEYLSGDRTERAEDVSYDDVALIASGDGQMPPSVRREIVAGYRPYLEALQRGDPPLRVIELLDDQRVLCALRHGPQGVTALNDAIEAWLAAEVDGFRPRSRWYLGRPVIVTENDYGVGLFNGDVGVVVADPDEPDRRVVAFPTTDGGVRLLSPTRIPPSETVFATTIHKSQGSQYGRVLVVLPRRSSPILTRELVYTGVTRARSHVTVLATEDVLLEALSRPVQRASGLGDALWGGDVT